MAKSKELEELLKCVRDVLGTTPVSHSEEYGFSGCVYCEENCYFSGKHSEYCEYLKLQNAYENYK